MRRTLPLIAILIGLLAFPAGAFSSHAPVAKVAVGGHDKPTRKLENAFKIALVKRKYNQGCYLPAKRMRKALRKKRIKATIATSLNKVSGNLVNVVKRGASCDRVIFGLRTRGLLYVLDSRHGPVYVRGRRVRGTIVRRARPLRGVKLVSRGFPVAGADVVKRLALNCPGRLEPVGGGMIANPPPGADGEGIYPHSYERLGAQRGWHISVVMVDPTRPGTVGRRVTLQALCAKGMVPSKPTPHTTVFVRPGRTRSTVARCPKGQKLYSGGYQRSDFRTFDGSYVTESRAISARAWRVTGHAFGTLGGEITAIANCAKSKRKLFTEVSASVPVGAGAFARATTPTCPGGRVLAVGGFSLHGSPLGFIADGFFNPNGTWSASAFGYFGAAPSLTAYGYCLKRK